MLDANVRATLAAQIHQDRTKEATLSAAIEGTTVYATGSIGRLEAGTNSDLDVFVVSGAGSNDPLTALQSCELTADLIRTARQNDFPTFSRDGKFLTSHKLGDVLAAFGRPEDDYNNHFTARMLLLLESRCLFGAAAYDDVVGQILDRYWPVEHPRWLPFFLINDLVRYWKTLCLNYEGFRAPGASPGERHLAVLKLRYSRMWTCFSGLAYLLAAIEGDCIPRTRALKMVSTTPVERMLDMAARHESVRGHVDDLLQLYVAFLKLTSSTPKTKLEERLADREQWETYSAASDDFGLTMHKLVTSLTTGTVVERFLLI